MAKKDIVPKKVGGFAFFLSLGALLFLGIFNGLSILSLSDQLDRLNLSRFLTGAFIGSSIAWFFFRGHLSVFVHELKHSIVSNFAGNRAKKMMVKSDSGYFEYEYTKDSREYNAFIALAPYFFPLMTLFVALLVVTFFRENHELAALFLGVGAGVDALMNFRDMAPHQTDITSIRGGYLVGVSYILLMNLVLLSFLLAWVLYGSLGLKFLIYGLWQFALHIVGYYWTK